MDHARCQCLTRWDPVMNKHVRYTKCVTCPIHGDLVAKDPVRPWRLSQHDRIFLRTMRIDPEEV